VTAPRSDLTPAGNKLKKTQNNSNAMPFEFISTQKNSIFRLFEFISTQKKSKKLKQRRLSNFEFF